jgi:predicted small secreted protein
MARHVWAGAALVIAALMLSACATSVAGRAIRASGQSPPVGSTGPHVAVSARDLLLQDGDATPLGPAVSAPVGDSYFTSARPPDCSAALLFKGSPLLPPGSSDHAESAYRLRGPALYAESIDVYKTLKTHDIVSKGFAAVAQCRGDAIGVAPLGESRPMRLSFFGTTDDGVLVWTMTRADWTCDYGLAVLPRVALMLSACDTKPGFPMTDWASKRRAQLDRRTA